MSEDKSTEEVLENIKDTVEEAVEDVKETVEEAIGAVEDAAEQAKPFLVNLKDENPKVFFGGIAPHSLAIQIGDRIFKRFQTCPVEGLSTAPVLDGPPQIAVGFVTAHHHVAPRVLHDKHVAVRALFPQFFH